VTRAQFFWGVLRFNGDTAVLAVLRDFCDFAYFFDNSGKHGDLQCISRVVIPSPSEASGRGICFLPGGKKEQIPRAKTGRSE
jgi:hypothetical protein